MIENRASEVSKEYVFYSSNVVLLFCILSLSRQQKLVQLKKCQMLIFFFNKINAELNAFMIRTTNTITGVSLIRCKRKHYFVRKTKIWDNGYQTMSASWSALVQCLIRIWVYWKWRNPGMVYLKLKLE